MIIVQLDTEQLNSLIQNAVRKVISETPKVETPQSETSQYLSVKEAAKFLNLAPQTIYQLVCAGKLKNFKRSKRLYFSLEYLQEFIQQGERKTFAEIAEENNQFLKTKKA